MIILTARWQQDGQPTERDRCGKRTLRPNRQVPWSLDSVEIITEFHIARDLMFADRLSPAVLISPEDQATEPERHDAPDLVIVLDNELVVCEGKFFDDHSSASLNAQLRSQRRQVRLDLREHASQLVFISHVDPGDDDLGTGLAHFFHRALRRAGARRVQA